jgi:hypothetical protein
MTVEWRKSSHSGGVNDSACVEVARLSAAVGIRDSKDPGAGHLSLTGRQFVQLTAQIKALS